MSWTKKRVALDKVRRILGHSLDLIPLHVEISVLGLFFSFICILYPGFNYHRMTLKFMTELFVPDLYFCYLYAISNWLSNKHFQFNTTTTEICFFTVLEARNSRPRCQQCCFLVRPFILACRWSPHCVLV